ncbi:MAG TPA: hypothetical protein VGE62_03200 [Candidatus Paceibacterota bacterium]
MDPINPFENNLNPNLAPSPARTNKTALAVLVLILAGVSVFAYKYVSQDMEPGTPAAESQIASPDQRATSSDADIEAELDMVLDSDTDAEMNQIDREFSE